MTNQKACRRLQVQLLLEVPESEADVSVPLLLMKKMPRLLLTGKA
jgi:hypothetical protein